MTVLRRLQLQRCKALLAGVVEQYPLAFDGLNRLEIGMGSLPQKWSRRKWLGPVDDVCYALLNRESLSVQRSCDLQGITNGILC